MAMSLLLCIFTFQPIDKAVSLVHAIQKTNELCTGLAKPDDASKLTIRKSAILKGRFKANADIEGMEELDDGTIVVKCQMRVPHPDQNRYKTDSEKAEIAKKNDEVSKTARNGAKHAETSRDVNDWRAVQARRRELEKHEAILKNKKKALANKAKSVKMTEQMRKDACEIISISVEIHPSLAKELDMPKIIKRGKLNFEGGIRGFDLGTEPKEVSGNVRVAGLTMTATKVE